MALTQPTLCCPLRRFKRTEYDSEQPLRMLLDWACPAGAARCQPIDGESGDHALDVRSVGLIHVVLACTHFGRIHQSNLFGALLPVGVPHKPLTCGDLRITADEQQELRKACYGLCVI